MVQDAASRAGVGQLDTNLTPFQRPETYVIDKDGQARMLPSRKPEASRMPTFRKFNTTVFDQDSGRRKGKPGTLSALQGASRIPFANMIVAAAAGWQLYKYVKHRFFKKPQQPSKEGEEDQDAQDPAQQQSLEQQAVAHALQHALPRLGGPSLARQRAQQHRSRASKVAGGTAKAAAQVGQGGLQRKQGMLERWDYQVKQQATASVQQQQQEQQKPRRGRRQQQGEDAGLAKGFLLPGAAAAEGVQTGAPGQKGVRGAGLAVQHAAELQAAEAGAMDVGQAGDK